MERDYDVVLFGATGFVGRLVADELARAATGPIALAGRDRAKVQAVADQLRAEHGREVPVLVADAFDQPSLETMAARARVVVSVVGPYLKYGHGVVRACAEQGTHYVDLNGEVLFARDCIDEFDQTARHSGASIVTACGFDSIPSDLGVLLAATTAREAQLGELLDTTLHVTELSGGMSGGTIDALRTQIDNTRSGRRTPGRSTSDPYALSPDRDAEPEPRRRQGQVWLETSGDTRAFAVPFFMGRYNAQVVRRSNALLGWAYGRSFRYREVHDTGRGAKGLALAATIGAALPVTVAGLSVPLLRPLADRLLPSPGEGPSDRARARGHFAVEVHAHTTSGATVVSRVADDRDPGYDGTAVLLSQAALALAAGEGLARGVLTPAVALGLPYAERLRAQGFELSTRVEPARR